jgi:DNA-directed RNA polymerase specialized sigma24 family protein
MQNLAPPEPEARVRLTHDQAQELVLRTVATQAESLLRTAYRHSLCLDDAHDAYQRSMEIFLRRAPTLDPAAAHKWLHVVVKHEAQEVRRARSASVPFEAIDFERHAVPDAATPEERALTVDRTTRAAEALRRLKPQELRAMWLKALGHSYAEIAEATGFSATKVNRCLTEGRKSFLERFEGIEAGVECRRWQPVLSAMVDGEATAAQITEARPHLRNCPACRATLGGLHRSRSPLAAVLPVGLVGAGAKLSSLVERLLPGAGGEAGGAAAGGAGVLGIGGAKLAGLLAAGAAATATAAGGGLVVAHDDGGRHAAAARRGGPAPAVAVARTVATTPTVATARSSRPAATRQPRHHQRVVARRRSANAPIEFVPRGAEPASTPALRAAPKAVRATAPRPVPSGPDSTRGEFAPQP